MIAARKLFPTVSLLFILVFSLLANPQPAQAACAPNHIVYVRPAGSNAGGCSWATAFTTLQSALAIATSGDQIWVAAGTYYPDEGTGQTNNAQASTFLLTPEVSIYGGFNGTETLLTQRNSNPATNNTVLSGDIDQDGLDADNALNVVTINAGGLAATYVLDGFTITNGYEDSGSALGGGMYIQDTNPTLSNLIIRDSFATSNGGGVFILSNATVAANYSSPTFTNVIFDGNSAARGGGLYLQNASPTLTQVTFTGNSATGGAGGALNSQVLNLTDEVSIPVLTDVVFAGNDAIGGGGMFVTYSNAILNQVTFSSNTATRRGGAMLIEIASPSLTNVTFNGNISTETAGAAPRGGGAIMNVTGSPIINNATFSGNNSLIVGGDAIRNATNSAPLIRNSIFWNDADDEITSDAGSTVTISDSVVEGGFAGGTNIVATDPLLGALVNNGGFTQTMALGVGSSAIDAGNNATCAATDQRGMTRPQGAGCDIGAYEAGDLTAPTLISFTWQSPAGSPTNADTLVFRVTFSEPATNVSTDDFQMNGTTTATVTNVNTINTTIYDVTISGGDLAGFNGIVGLDLAAGQNITDTNANALPAGEPATDETYLLDNTAPTATMSSAAPDPTNTSPIPVTVQFSETVTGFIATDITPGNGTIGNFVAVDGDTFAFDLSPVGQGLVTADIAAGVAQDAAGNGNTAVAQFSRTFDSVAPDTTLTATPTDPSADNTPTFTFIGSDGGSGVASFECQLDSGGFSACASGDTFGPLADGSHTFEVHAVDVAGNTDPSPASFTWTVDTTAPDTTLGSTPANPDNDTTSTFTFSSPDATASFECQVDGGGFAACTSGDSFGPLADGSHTFQVRAVDLLGNTDPTPASFTWLIDTGVPNTTIDSNPATPSNSASAGFTFSSPDADVVGFECQLDGNGFAACTTPRIYLGLSAGSHTFEVRAVDSAANVDPTPASFTWTVDLGYPTVSTTTPANNAALTAGPTQLTVTFSEEVKNDGSAGAANNPVNYLLVEDGLNEAFNTVSCAGGLVAEDAQIAINSATYTNSGGSGPFTATLNINGGVALPPGTYRLFICGTTSIEDPAGNELNNGASDALLDFTVIPPTQSGGGGGQNASLLPATGFPLNRVTELPVQPANKAYAATDLWLEIPRLGVKMSIVGVPQTSAGWDVTWLNQQAGWLAGSAFPTWQGNSVLTGHVWDALNRPGPFARLKDLKYGDQIRIHAFGLVYLYEITENTPVAPSSTRTAFQHADKTVLTLITCEDFQPSSQTYAARRMVRATLVSVSPDK